MARVLIVEDDPHVGAELAAELEIRGYQVRWVRDAQAGAPKGDSPPPAVVVMDYFLPLGDGIDLCDRWKATQPRPAVILLSGADVTSEVHRRLVEPHRPDRLLAKPISTGLVVAEIGRLVPGGAPAPAAAAARRRRATPVEISTLTLPDLLWRLAGQQASGALEIADGGFSAIVHLLNGDPVFVESGSLDETLGRLLLRRGVLTQEQYERVLRKMTDELVSGEDVRFGEIVVQMGFATAELVVEALREQVREKLVNLFHRPKPNVAFRPGRDELAVGNAFRVDTAEVIREGILRHWGPPQLEPVLAPHLDHYVALAAAFDEQRRRFRFAPREERFLGQIAGGRTMRALIEAGGIDRVHAMQVLVVLTLTDSVELALDPMARAPHAGGPRRPAREVPSQPPTAAREHVLARHLRTSGRSFYEVLGVAPNAAPEAIEAAFRQLEAQFAPEQLVAMSLGDVHERATEVWARIRQAYDTLSDPARRAQYDAARRASVQKERQTELAAEAAFQRGLRELGGGQVMRAMVEFAKARALAPREAEYACYELWASCLGAVEGGADLASTAREARARMEAALVDRRPGPRARYVLALACKVLGDLVAAREHLRAALAFDPGFDDARRLFEAIAEPSPSGTLLG